MTSKPLGRGLGALLKTPASAAPLPGEEVGGGVRQLRVDEIAPGPFQPRRDFDEEALEELASSIRAQGVLQPVTVRRRSGGFELIAGERRWRASQRAGLTEIPALIREATDEQVLEWALIENLQREDLNPIEEAEGLGRLQAQFSLTQEQIAAKVGKSRPAVANALRLLELEPQVKGFLAKGLLSVGHGKVLLAVKEPALQRELSERVVRESLNVRQTEAAIAKVTGRTERGTSAPGGTSSARGGGTAAPSSHLRDLQERLRQHLGTQVSVQHHASGKGRIEIEYYTLDDLTRIVEALGLRE